MANDDDNKSDDKPVERPVKKTLMGVGTAGAPPKDRMPVLHAAKADLDDASASEQVAQAAAEEAVASMKLAEAKAEPHAGERKLKAEVAAAKASEAKTDAEKASAHAQETGDDGAEAGAEMTKAKAAQTRADALEEAAAAAGEERHPVGRHGAAASPTDPDELPDTRPALFLAEYDNVEDLVHAAEQVRDAGYESWDVHTPYPVHGLDQAMGLPETKIGYISFICGMVGLASAVLMIQFMNNWDYPIIIGGKPPGAFPSMVPIMFELTVLLTGFGTLFGLLHLARLPMHHHPIFESDRFESATDDHFFISIETKDPKFDLTKTRMLLENTHPSHLELVEEEIA